MGALALTDALPKICRARLVCGRVLVDRPPQPTTERN
jgi:hypothetical protein